MQNNKSLLPNYARIFTAFFSVLLSIFLVVNDDLINSDGILYIQTASAFLSGGFDAASELYNWPFYSILIAGTHKIFHLSLEQSALMLNILFFVLLTDALYLICRKTLPSQQHVLIAMLIFISFYTLNDYRDFIIRDVGYWAFSLLSIFWMMAFLERQNWCNAFCWQLCMVLAIIFRTEGVFLLLALPLFSLFSLPHPNKLKSYLSLNILALTGLFSLLLSPYMASIFSDWEKLGVWLAQDGGEIFQNFSLKAEQASQPLPSFAHKHSKIILSTGLISLVLFLIAKAIHIGYIGFYIVARKSSATPLVPHYRFLQYATILNALILFAFVFKHYFMTTRYCVMTVLLLLLLMLPAITDYILRAWHNKKRFILFLFVGLLAVLLQVSIHSSVSKTYVKSTAIWASENLPRNSRVATNNHFIAYYFNIRIMQTGHHPATLIQSSDIPTGYDHIIYVEKKKRPLSKAISESIQSHQNIYQQQNKRGDKASIISF